MIEVQSILCLAPKYNIFLKELCSSGNVHWTFWFNIKRTQGNLNVPIKPEFGRSLEEEKNQKTHKHWKRQTTFIIKYEYLFRAPIVYFIDGRSPSEFLHLTGALIEHFLKGSALSCQGFGKLAQKKIFVFFYSFGLIYQCFKEMFH